MASAKVPPGTDEVAVRRHGNRIILEPLEREEWPDAFWQAVGTLSEDFGRPRQVAQRREDLAG